MIAEHDLEDLAASAAALLLERRYRLREAGLDRIYLRIHCAMNLMMCVVDCNNHRQCYLALYTALTNILEFYRSVSPITLPKWLRVQWIPSGDTNDHSRSVWQPEEFPPS